MHCDCSYSIFIYCSIVWCNDEKCFNDRLWICHILWNSTIKSNPYNKRKVFGVLSQYMLITRVLFFDEAFFRRRVELLLQAFYCIRYCSRNDDFVPDNSIYDVDFKNQKKKFIIRNSKEWIRILGIFGKRKIGLKILRFVIYGEVQIG